MKKKFSIHLDAVLVIVILFCGLISLTIFQQSQINDLTVENQKLQWKGVENSFNLDSQKNYIEKLERQINNADTEQIVHIQ
ncbi:hypothetical protein [Psychromonas aquimarina]|uniref:hypothetical protein n=1 Tax=Psychromonas aquimarina TaxID=444919 RepID=UPI0004014829|nr:hypothetical protein [Psychromonas aquimarina]